MSTITMWYRLEPRARSTDLAESLAARVNDPLWFLTRQWQFGEFGGEDGGSAVAGHVRGQVAPLTHVRLGPSGAASARQGARSAPLEPEIESGSHGNGSPTAREAADAGTMWLAMLTEAGLPQYRTTYIIAMPQPDGRTLYRLYYTLLPGLKDPDYLANGTWHVIEHKVCVAAHSWDGIEWSDRRVVLERRRDVPTEDIGVVGLNVWKTKKGYRGIYTGLGTKFRTYALAEAASVDGLTWNRGVDQDNVSLTLQPGKWDGGMIGYPCVLPENGSVRLFYNGAGGGGTGVGMAVAVMLDND